MIIMALYFISWTVTVNKFIVSAYFSLYHVKDRKRSPAKLVCKTLHDCNIAKFGDW